MPTVNVTTNVSRSGVDDVDALLQELTRAASKAIGKPVQYFVAIVNYDAALAFGGDGKTAAAYTEVSSIGSIGGEKNADIVAALTAVLEQRLGVPSDRCYINFHDIGASDWGWKGTTFDRILAGKA